MRDETVGEIARMLVTLRSDDAGRVVLAEQRPKSTRMMRQRLPCARGVCGPQRPRDRAL